MLAAACGLHEGRLSVSNRVSIRSMGVRVAFPRASQLKITGSRCERFCHRHLDRESGNRPNVSSRLRSNGDEPLDRTARSIYGNHWSEMPSLLAQHTGFSGVFATAHVVGKVLYCGEERVEPHMKSC